MAPVKPETRRAWNARNRERNREYARAYRQAHPYGDKYRTPEARRAQSALGQAIRSGRIVRPETCEECGTAPGPNAAGHSQIHGHHEDYSRPYDVEWLCVSCHGRKRWAA